MANRSYNDTFNATASVGPSPLSASNLPIQYVKDPTLPQEAATKAYVDGAAPTGANTTLSNLGTVALNADLQPDLDADTNCGRPEKAFNNMNAWGTNTQAMYLYDLNTFVTPMATDALVAFTATITGTDNVIAITARTSTTPLSTTNAIKLDASGGLMIPKLAATPTVNPATGFMKLYFKTDEKLYCLNPSGVEVLIGSQV